MPKNTHDVIVGLADYGTTGAVLVGDVITTIPATLDDAITAITQFTGTGYVSEDGLTLTTEYDTTTVKEWNKSSVRTLLNDFTGTVAFTLIQADYDGWCMLVGAENVTKTTANDVTNIHVKIGSHLPPRRAFAVKMKDSDDRAMLLLVPNGQVTSGLDVTFSAGDVVRLPIEVDCLDDGTGESIHFYDKDEA